MLEENKGFPFSYIIYLSKKHFLARSCWYYCFKFLLIILKVNTLTKRKSLI